jgi:hypothetical protein
LTTDWDTVGISRHGVARHDDVHDAVM